MKVLQRNCRQYLNTKISYITMLDFDTTLYLAKIQLFF